VQVSKEKKGKVVDSRCRDLTSAFACEKGRAEPGSVPLCSFHEVGPDRDSSCQGWIRDWAELTRRPVHCRS
jgi:hypothetical protein